MSQIQRRDGSFCGENRIAENLLGRLRVDVDIELGPRSPIAETLAIAIDFTHGSVGETTSHCTAHDRQSCYMFDQVREGVEQ